MKSNILDYDELLLDNKRLIRNLDARISKIEGIQGRVPSSAKNQFRELQSNLPKDLRDLSLQDMRNLNRDLKYINSLKTSTVKGVMKAALEWQPIEDKLNTLSEDRKAEFFKAYEKLYSENPSRVKYKYEYFDMIIETMLEGGDLDKFVSDVIQEYREFIEEQGAEGMTQNEHKLFLSELRKYFS